MKCLVCNFSGEFGTIEAKSPDRLTSLIGTLPNHPYSRTVTIRVCPNCGALHSTMNNLIEMNERKE